MTLPFRRRPDSWSMHERARARAAERLSAPIDAEEAAWLDRHLSDCAACHEVAAAYERDSLELRARRHQAVEPPRDLWARTAAAIEREARSGTERRRSRLSDVPLGAISGLLVVAVVFGATLLSDRSTPSVPPIASPLAAMPSEPARTPAPVPTPLAARGEVEWLRYGGQGRIVVYRKGFSEVCPANGAECAPLEDPTSKTEVEVEAAPNQVILSSDDANLIVVDDNGEAGTDNILVVPIPTPTGGPTPPPTIAPDSSSSPAPTESPSTTVGPSPSEPPLASPTPEPIESPSPPASPPPSVDPSPAPTPFEIAHDVVLVGPPEFDPDGTRLAFSARPADGSRGPDIFVWTAGEPEATPVTTDHRSVFSGWLDGLVLGSRPVDPTAAVTSAETFVVDPETRAEAAVEGVAAWRPSVDPTGMFAAYWDGAIALDENGVDWYPADGRLIVGAWPGTPEVPRLDEPTAEEPEASNLPVASAEPTLPPPSASTGDAADRAPVVLLDARVRDWVARWDGYGARLAVWVADDDDPTIGRLSLYALDEETGRIDADDPELSGELARPGFSIEAGRLAWATREGQDGKGSHVKVVAWTAMGTGTVETKPGDEVLIVQR